MAEITSFEKKIELLKRTTNMLYSLTDSYKAPNGWGIIDVLIHIWTWDVEYIRLVEMKLKGEASKFQFEYEKLVMKYTIWNDYIMEKHRAITLRDARKQFLDTRKKLISLLEELIKKPETITDPKSYKRTESILEIWSHDQHHLERGGIRISTN
ncbi:MAG: ClbS/DfsB family four-helix bundle protein [Asgard group archaeon]|nr:ClbS/DfsB family four-helix bundle protein [Asgard group archaeon]